MKIQITSDLHIEMYKNPQLRQFVKQTSAKVLFILGDLGIPYLPSYEKFVKECSDSYEKTFIVAGNHEYYQYKNTIPITFYDTNNLITSIIDKYENVYFLNNNDHVLNDKYVLLGTTLWSHIPPEKFKIVKKGMNDFKQIYFFDEKTGYNEQINDKFINEINKQNVSWLTNKLHEYKDKKIITLTHHLPSYKMISPKYINHDCTCCFANNLDDLITGQMKYWFSGHTHDNVDLMINGCRCIVNPCGYPAENKKYVDDYVIDLED